MSLKSLYAFLGALTCLSLVVVTIVLVLKHMDEKELSEYTDELLIDKRQAPTEDEILNAIAHEVPALPFRELSQWTAAKRLNGTCAPYPHLFDLKLHDIYWQTFRNDHVQFELLSAFYDRRAIVANSPVVRILAMVNQIDQEFPTTYCQMWFGERDEPSIVAINDYKAIWYASWGTYDKAMYPHLITCPIANDVRDLIPKTISLVANECDKATNMLKIIYEPSMHGGAEEHKGGFAICVKGMDFPHVDMSARFVEWLELMHILGADKVMLYNLQIHPNTTKVLDHYARQGFVELRHFTNSRGEPHTPNFYHKLLRMCETNKRLHEVIVLNDCFYRNIHKYDYVAVIDVDEVIMPLGNLTDWHDLIEMAEQLRPSECQGKFASFCFSNIYFPRYPERPLYTQEIPEYFYMLQHVLRVAKHLDPYSATKCLHNTEHVLSVHNHFPLHYMDSCYAEPINETWAQMQHYREPDVAEDLLTPVVDANIWRFKDVLVNRSMSVFRELGFFRKLNSTEIRSRMKTDL